QQIGVLPFGNIHFYPQRTSDQISPMQFGLDDDFNDFISEIHRFHEELEHRFPMLDASHIPGIHFDSRNFPELYE
ncbi:MAG: hypothetical protein LBI27_04735, partial [Clostridiales bacterium]|nr:hypothetical protein [Clostridiales bacterium]